jgi:CHAT domain
MKRTLVFVGRNNSKEPTFYLEEPRLPESRTQYSLLFPTMTFTADPSTSFLEISGHGLRVSQEVAVQPNLGSVLPPPLQADVSYFTVDVQQDRFKLATTPGGSPVKILALGTGNNYLLAWQDMQSIKTMLSGMPAMSMKKIGEIILSGLRRHPAIVQRFSSALTQDPGPICFYFDTPETEQLPWEAIYDNVETFLALQPKWPVVRLKEQLDSSFRTFAYEPPLRILAVLGATHPNISAVNEWQSLYKATNNSDIQVRVLTCDASLIATINKLGNWRFTAEQTESELKICETLRDWAPQILHVFAHGSSENGQMHIVIGTGADERLQREGTIKLTATKLLNYINRAVPPWLAVLNCCKSAMHTAQSANLASSLAACGFPIVIGMRAEVASQHTSVLTEKYYTSIVQLIGKAPRGAVQEIDWAANLWEVRNAIQVVCETPPEACVYWTLPLFYMRREPVEIYRIADDDLSRTTAPALGRVSGIQIKLEASRRGTSIDLSTLLGNS